MERQSFVVYKVWLESAKLLTDDVDTLKDCALAILEYGFYGKEYTGDNRIVKVVMMNAIPQMDANNRKCNNGGGSPVGNKNALKQPKVEKKTTYALNANDNVNVNVNVIENENENVNENDVLYSAEAHELLCADDRYSKFCLWLKEHTPYLYKNCEHIITERELLKLLKSYTIVQICDMIMHIENRKDKRKTYSNLYLTTFNWLKREYGKPSERPILE